jgi:hypothetical protein
VRRAGGTALSDAARADAVRAAAEAAARQRGNDAVRAYHNVRVAAPAQGYPGSASAGARYSMLFDTPGGRAVDWAKTSRLKTGSLLCLSPGGSFDEHTLVLATVVRPPQPPAVPGGGARAPRSGMWGSLAASAKLCVDMPHFPTCLAGLVRAVRTQKASSAGTQFHLRNHDGHLCDLQVPSLHLCNFVVYSGRQCLLLSVCRAKRTRHACC